MASTVLRVRAEAGEPLPLLRPENVPSLAGAGLGAADPLAEGRLRQVDPRVTSATGLPLLALGTGGTAMVPVAAAAPLSASCARARCLMATSAPFVKHREGARQRRAGHRGREVSAPRAMPRDGGVGVALPCGASGVRDG